MAQVLGQQFIGRQYHWLAAYCRKAGTNDMELSVQMDGRVFNLIRPYVETTADGNHILRPDAPQPLHLLFGLFRFPILNFSKLDMLHHAESMGLKSVMGLTWFCHRPILKHYPCGTCNPCIYTVQEGLGYRLPWFSIMRYHLRIYPRLKKLVTRYPAVYQILYRKLR